MTKIKKSSFYPVSSLDGKNNFKEFKRIERDGSIIERVFLDISDPSKREEIICLHYLRHIGRHFYDESFGVNILSRDCPWDFKVELSLGHTFNLEITSIADMNEHFIINKREERFNQWKYEHEIPLHELDKLNRLFPNDTTKRIIDSLYASGKSENDMVKNPIKGCETNLFLSNMPETNESLKNIIENVIQKKEEKNHSEKETTVLVIDNRTSIFELSDFHVAARELSVYCESLPFPEIWFYTGYCSDNDGNNAEFSFAPIKVTNPQEVILEKMAGSGSVDTSGKVVW
jgi:hypothetical protein